MKQGQLAAVLVMVLLVAAVGAFVVFSSKQAGQAISLRTQQPSNINTQAASKSAPGAQFNFPPGGTPQAENPAPGQQIEKPKCSYSCSCPSSSYVLEGTCIFVTIDPITKKEKRTATPFPSAAYPKDKNGVIGSNGGTAVFRCTATAPSSPATFSSDECTTEAKTTACNTWASTACAVDFTECTWFFVGQCADSLTEAQKRAGTTAEVKLTKEPPKPPKAVVGR